MLLLLLVILNAALQSMRRLPCGTAAMAVLVSTAPRCSAERAVSPAVSLSVGPDLARL
jgi:hypothetical protein